MSRRGTQSVESHAGQNGARGVMVVTMSLRLTGGTNPRFLLAGPPADSASVQDDGRTTDMSATLAWKECGQYRIRFFAATDPGELERQKSLTQRSGPARLRRVLAEGNLPMPRRHGLAPATDAAQQRIGRHLEQAVKLGRSRARLVAALRFGLDARSSYNDEVLDAQASEPKIRKNGDKYANGDDNYRQQNAEQRLELEVRWLHIDLAACSGPPPLSNSSNLAQSNTPIMLQPR